MQAFLFESHPNIFLDQSDTLDHDNEPTSKELDQWRKLGLLGKTHNLVLYILHTPQRLQKF